jgi:hypothetical protein
MDRKTLWNLDDPSINYGLTMTLECRRVRNVQSNISLRGGVAVRPSTAPAQKVHAISGFDSGYGVDVEEIRSNEASGSVCRTQKVFFERL